MFLRLFLILSLLLFVGLTLTGSDPLNAFVRSSVVFISLSLIYYLTYLMIKIIGHVPEKEKESESKQEQQQQRQQQQQQQQTQVGNQ